MSGTQTLLADYVKNGSERAFRELVTAYIDFVFATALRVVGGDRAMAEDVSQTVFTDLASKALTLPRDVKLGGWLHRHTCFVGYKALRRERRRIARERQAMQLTTIQDYTQENLARISPILDETINGLGKDDRNAIILRFFEQLDYHALGAALGSSEDAARMRVSRALEKMGAILRRRGFALSAAGLGFMLSTKTATAAPVGLAAKVSTLALAQSLKGWAIFSFLKDACLTRLNLGIAGGAVGLLGALILFIPARHTHAVFEVGKQISSPADIAGLTTEETDTAAPLPQENPPGPAREAPATAAPPQVASAIVPAVWKPVTLLTVPKTNLPSPPASPPPPQSPPTAPAVASAPASASASSSFDASSSFSTFPVHRPGWQPFSPGSTQASASADELTRGIRRYGNAPTWGPPKSTTPPPRANKNNQNNRPGPP